MVCGGCQKVEGEGEEGRVDRRGVRSRGSEGESCRWGRAWLCGGTRRSFMVRYEVAWAEDKDTGKERNKNFGQTVKAFEEQGRWGGGRALGRGVAR